MVAVEVNLEGYQTGQNRGVVGKIVRIVFALEQVHCGNGRQSREPCLRANSAFSACSKAEILASEMHHTYTGDKPHEVHKTKGPSNLIRMNVTPAMVEEIYGDGDEEGNKRGCVMMHKECHSQATREEYRKARQIREAVNVCVCLAAFVLSLLCSHFFLVLY